MLHARPETLVLLGALLTGSLDPAGKHQVPPGVSLSTSGVEGREKCSQAVPCGWTIRSDRCEAQPPHCADIATRVGLGMLGEPEKHGLRPWGTRGVAGRLAPRGPLSDPQAARTHSHCPGKCSAMTAGSTT